MLSQSSFFNNINSKTLHRRHQYTLSLNNSLRSNLIRCLRNTTIPRIRPYADQDSHISFTPLFPILYMVVNDDEGEVSIWDDLDGPTIHPLPHLLSYDPISQQIDQRHLQSDRVLLRCHSLDSKDQEFEQHHYVLSVACSDSSCSGCRS